MAEQLVDRVLREIRERMSASRAAVEESRRLEAALAALDRSRDSERPSAAPSRRTRRVKESTAKRAPRGQNLRQIREAIAERPGATAGEIASATGIARPTVASTLGKLVRDGELERTELPGGAVGFRAATGQATPGPVIADTSSEAVAADAAESS